MNLATAIALYATISRELGEDFYFPGSLRMYLGYDSFTSSELYAGRMTNDFTFMLNKSSWQNSTNGPHLNRNARIRFSMWLTATSSPCRTCGRRWPNISGSTFRLANSPPSRRYRRATKLTNLPPYTNMQRRRVS